LQGGANFVESFEEPPAGVVVDSYLACGTADSNFSFNEFDSHLLLGVVVKDGPNLFYVVLIDLPGEESLLTGIASEDVRKPRAEDGADAIVPQGPHRMVAAGAGSEVRASRDRGP
jgi:hypothetical protein